MGFLNSLFDFNGDGKVDWLDELDELAAMHIIMDEDEEDINEDDDDF